MFAFDEDGQCYLSTSSTDFIGWSLLGWEQWKEGVKRVYVKKDRSFFIVFAKDEHVQWLIDRNKRDEV